LSRSKNSLIYRPNHPHNPTLNLPPLLLILTVFCNSILLSLIWPLTFFTLNLKGTLKGNNMFKDIQLTLLQKVRLFFTARQIPLEKLDGLQHFPAEQIEIQNRQPTRKPLRLMKAETDTTKHLQPSPQTSIQKRYTCLTHHTRHSLLHHSPRYNTFRQPIPLDNHTFRNHITCIFNSYVHITKKGYVQSKR